jgi:hypothetical protein
MNGPPGEGQALSRQLGLCPVAATGAGCEGVKESDAAEPQQPSVTMTFSMKRAMAEHLLTPAPFRLNFRFRGCSGSTFDPGAAAPYPPLCLPHLQAQPHFLNLHPSHYVPASLPFCLSYFSSLPPSLSLSPSLPLSLSLSLSVSLPFLFLSLSPAPRLLTPLLHRSLAILLSRSDNLHLSHFISLPHALVLHIPLSPVPSRPGYHGQPRLRRRMRFRREHEGIQVRAHPEPRPSAQTAAASTTSAVVLASPNESSGVSRRRRGGGGAVVGEVGASGGGGAGRGGRCGGSRAGARRIEVAWRVEKREERVRVAAAAADPRQATRRVTRDDRRSRMPGRDADCQTAAPSRDPPRDC